MAGPERRVTARLVLDRPVLADAPALLAFMGDADAMRHTRCVPDLRAMRRDLAADRCQARRVGFGPWTVRARDDGAVIGFGGLSDDPFDPGWGVEVIYFFAPAVWGRGYAGELVAASLEEATRRHGLTRVRAFAHPENAASLRVLRRAGFVEERYVPEMTRWLLAWGAAAG